MLNLILSIVLGRRVGIAGIFLGTLLSALLTSARPAICAFVGDGVLLAISGRERKGIPWEPRSGMKKRPAASPGPPG